ncbi:MAG: hypothetical protein GY714_18180 [Desulfobacterales bacterium]|nr:hypothetical protein [Desulfobacterales bacterium]
MVEPWTVMSCSKCNSTYHLADGSKCECGKDEAKERQLEFLGEYHGFTAIKRAV